MLIFAGVGTFDFANASAMIFSICDFFTARSVKFASAAASSDVAAKLFVAQLHSQEFKRVKQRHLIPNGVDDFRVRF